MASSSRGNRPPLVSMVTVIDDCPSHSLYRQRVRTLRDGQRSRGMTELVEPEALEARLAAAFDHTSRKLDRRSG
jgi:hypothetical protein